MGSKEEYLFSEIKRKLGASSVVKDDSIQPLWSGYGEVYRIKLEGFSCKSLIVKQIYSNAKSRHPYGKDSNYSHIRKVKSYEVERNWYQFYNNKTDDSCRTPKLILETIINGDQLFLLEDLESSGFPLKVEDSNRKLIKVVLKWLASFHAKFLDEKVEHLWKVGTYWNLETRPEEYDEMTNSPLKNYAIAIDRTLNNCTYQTLVHGDAKLANFCFSENLKEVAAVDFQYVGTGCGMKDVAYFLGSYLDEVELEQTEVEFLNYYFDTLENELTKSCKRVSYEALKSEWTQLYSFVWADFSRFLLGWKPDHYKLNAYSKKMVEKTLSAFKEKDV